MNILERYIFKRAGLASLSILLALAGVVWIVQALGKIDIITAKGQTLYAYFMLTTLVIPMLFLAIIPIALLLGTVFTINSLNTSSELVVINASGASNRLVAKPFLILALLVSIFSGFVGHFVIGWSLTSLKAYSTQMKADLITIIIREGEFNEVEKGLIFHIAKRGADGRLNGIMITDSRDESQSLTYLAREGVLSQSDDQAFLLLRDGEIHQQDNKANTASIIRYDSYIFDLNTLSAKDASFSRRPKERSTIELLYPDPNDSYFKNKPELYNSQIHQRFSEMLWPFANVLIVLAFCGQARSSRQGYGMAITSAMILLLVLRGLAFSAASSIKANETAAIFLYILPFIAIVYATWYLARNKLVGVPEFLQPGLERFTLALEANISSSRQRYLAFRRRLAGVSA